MRGTELSTAMRPLAEVIDTYTETVRKKQFRDCNAMIAVEHCHIEFSFKYSAIMVENKLILCDGQTCDLNTGAR